MNTTSASKQQSSKRLSFKPVLYLIAFTMVTLGKNIHLNKITRRSNDGAGDTKERGSKLSVPLRKHHKY